MKLPELSQPTAVYQCAHRNEALTVCEVLRVGDFPMEHVRLVGHNPVITERIVGRFRPVPAFISWWFGFAFFLFALSYILPAMLHTFDSSAPSFFADRSFIVAVILSLFVGIIPAVYRLVMTLWAGSKRSNESWKIRTHRSLNPTTYIIYVEHRYSSRARMLISQSGHRALTAETSPMCVTPPQGTALNGATPQDDSVSREALGQSNSVSSAHATTSSASSDTQPPRYGVRLPRDAQGKTLENIDYVDPAHTGIDKNRDNSNETAS